jgi:molybdopterin synthase catalytic subunit
LIENRQIMAETVLVNGPITLEMISFKLGSFKDKPDQGGHSVFMGQVRADISEGKRVRAIEYSAYEEMVKTEAEKIQQTILSEFDDVLSIEILHSVGIVIAGEISLFVLVSSGHRNHAMAACSKIVELIKEKLPVWKKEIFEDDTHTWKQNRSD